MEHQYIHECELDNGSFELDIQVSYVVARDVVNDENGKLRSWPVIEDVKVERVFARKLADDISAGIDWFEVQKGDNPLWNEAERSIDDRYDWPLND